MIRLNERLYGKNERLFTGRDTTSDLWAKFDYYKNQ